MRFKHFLCIMVVFLFCAGCGSIAWAAEGEDAPNGKIEIVNIPDAKMWMTGEMLALNDEETLAEKIVEWPFYFHLLGGLSADDQEAGLTLETIDYSTIDIHTPGDYAVTVTLKLLPRSEEEFFISDAVRTLKIPVRVSDPEIFDLWICRVSSDNFRTQWLYPAISPEILYIESARKLDAKDIEKMEWKELPQEMGVLGDAFFGVFRNRLSLNTYYYFKLKGGEKHSNIVWFFEDGAGDAYGGWEGDRDGGDSSTQPPPEYTQPPPEYTQLPPEYTQPSSPKSTEEVDPLLPAKPSSGGDMSEATIPPVEQRLDTGNIADQAAQGCLRQKSGQTTSVPQEAAIDAKETDFQEFFGETTDIISGRRFKLMLENGGAARFSKQGITIAISKEAVSALKILDSDRISVTIQRFGDAEFSYDVQINDHWIETLENTQIMIPYQLRQSGSKLTAEHEDGTAYDLQYDVVLSVGSFCSDQTGRFTIDEQTIPLANIVSSVKLPGGGGILLIVFVCGGAGLCALGILLWKKRVQR